MGISRMASIKDYLYNLASGKSRGPLAALAGLFLYLLSLVYGLAVTVIIFILKIHPSRINRKVISVGNITLGGTGKTSLVEYIARYLSGQGHRPAILSRGYKAKSGLLGDEPCMLTRKLKGIPVIVDKNRLAAAQKAIAEYGADTVILDDGLQQWQIAKDLEIVTLDACNPFGNLKLLPAGFLRQPLSTLAKADIFVLTQANFCPEINTLRARLKELNPDALIAEALHRPLGFRRLGKEEKVFDPGIFKEENAAAFCGIGNPEGFEKTLAGLGVKLGLFLKFNDHYNYRQQDADYIAACAKEKGLEKIITTEKDAVKLSALVFKGCAIYTLEVGLGIIKDETEFNSRLLKLYRL